MGARPQPPAVTAVTAPRITPPPGVVRGLGSPPPPPTAGPSAEVVLVARDALLVEGVRVLAEAAGVLLRVMDPRDPPPRATPLVLVGTEVLEEFRAGPWPVVVVAGPRREELPDGVWRRALELAAERVTELPRGDSWLLERMARAVGPHRRAPVIGLLGGHGGSGASLLAAALAAEAADRGLRPVLVDGDELGGGIDLLLGAEEIPGLRWPDVAAVAGRLRQGLLAHGLPAVDGISLLSCDRGPEGLPGADVVLDVVDRMRREAGVVVVDLPRGRVAELAGLLTVCSPLVLVVAARVRAVAAAARLLTDVLRVVGDVRLVVRGGEGAGLGATRIADHLGLPLLGEVATDPRVAAAVERGGGLPRRTRRSSLGVTGPLLAEVVPAAPGAVR